MIFLALCVSLCAGAQQNRVYMDDFEIARGSTLTVPVMLANQDTTRGLQFDVSLPPGLRCEELELTQYIQRMRFILNNTIKDGVHNVMIYQLGTGTIPPGDAAVVEMTLKADSTFSGGDITLWKCRGSTRDNKSIYIDGDTVTVTVPMEPQGGFFLDAAPKAD